MIEVDASQLVHLGDHLTFTPDEISSYGHPIDELLVDVRISPTDVHLFIAFWKPLSGLFPRDKQANIQETLMVFQCEFDQTKCGASDFKTFGHAKYGLCHTFNHGFNQSALTTSHIGAEYGFKLLLYINQVIRNPRTWDGQIRAQIDELGIHFPMEPLFDQKYSKISKN